MIYFSWDKSATEIGRELNIEGGQLYHHLDHLLKSHYIEKVDRGVYSIDPDGWRALLTVVQLAEYMRDEAPELRKLLEEKRKRKLLEEKGNRADGTASS